MLNNLKNLIFESDSLKERVFKEVDLNNEFHFFTYLNGNLAYIWILKEGDDYFYRIEDEHSNEIDYNEEILVLESHLKQF